MTPQVTTCTLAIMLQLTLCCRGKVHVKVYMYLYYELLCGGPLVIILPLTKKGWVDLNIVVSG